MTTHTRPAPADIIIERLDAEAARAAIPALCDILSDCVEGGASLGFMTPFAPDAALPFWEGVAEAVAQDAVALIAARIGGVVAGTVQVGLKMPPNQPHRADIKKLLVHRSARGLGLARRLMDFAEQTALGQGKTVLVLDTATGEPAETIYERLGWSRVGVIPHYALMPDGRSCDTTFFYKHLGVV